MIAAWVTACTRIVVWLLGQVAIGLALVWVAFWAWFALMLVFSALMGPDPDCCWPMPPP